MSRQRYLPRCVTARLRLDSLEDRRLPSAGIFGALHDLSVPGRLVGSIEPHAAVGIVRDTDAGSLTVSATLTLGKTDLGVSLEATTRPGLSLEAAVAAPLGIDAHLQLGTSGEETGVSGRIGVSVPIIANPVVGSVVDPVSQVISQAENALPIVELPVEILQTPVSVGVGEQAPVVTPVAASTPALPVASSLPAGTKPPSVPPTPYSSPRATVDTASSHVAGLATPSLPAVTVSESATEKSAASSGAVGIEGVITNTELAGVEGSAAEPLVLPPELEPDAGTEATTPLLIGGFDVPAALFAALPIALHPGEGVNGAQISDDEAEPPAQPVDEPAAEIAANVEAINQALREVVNQVSNAGRQVEAAVAGVQWSYWAMALGLISLAVEYERRRRAVDRTFADSGVPNTFWFGGLGGQMEDDS